MPTLSDDLSLLTASQAAKAVQARQVTSFELVEAMLKRTEKYNPDLNAIVTLDADEARVKAREADAALQRGENRGAFQDVPITIKDAFDTAGMRTVSGYPPFANRIPKVDAPPVARLRAAGAIIMGKTNLPTLASGIQTNNPVF
jgi:amidase